MRSKTVMMPTSTGPANVNGMSKVRYLLEQDRYHSLPRTRLRPGWHVSLERWFSCEHKANRTRKDRDSNINYNLAV